MLRLFVAGIALLNGNALACSCPWKGTPEEHIANTPVIAGGWVSKAHVLSQEEHSKLFTLEEGGPYVPGTIAQASFEVQVAIKGSDTGDVLTVYYDVEGSSCSMAPSVGNGGVLFMDEFQGKLFAFSCSNELGGSGERRKEYYKIFEEMSGFDFPNY